MTVKITSPVVSADFWKFPAGERAVKLTGDLPSLTSKIVHIQCDFTGSDDVIDLHLVVDAIRELAPDAVITLTCLYFPAARHDRVMNHAECFGLRVYAKLITSLNFDAVYVLDAHSDVLAGMFPPGILFHTSQLQTAKAYFDETSIAGVALVSPDAGSLKKIYATAKHFQLPVIEAGKTRDIATGEILAVKVHEPERMLEYSHLVILDDICDGGRSFIELGKVIRAHGFTGKLTLVVSHGIFSKGKDVFSDFDDVFALNDMRNERMWHGNV